MEDAHATILNLNKVKGEDTFDEAIFEDEEEDHVEELEEDDGTSEHISFFGVYDGHGGRKAAIFTGKHLHRIVRNTIEFKNKQYTAALKEAFLECDRAILNNKFMKYDDSGCATTTAIVTPTTIYCGNAGDSRTIMSINGYAKALSYDHKPSNEGEKARICSAGGYVDMGRVNGNLALSRGIGDFEFKQNNNLPAEEQIVTCYPDVIEHTIDYSKDEFLVLACDGIWDCLTSQKCVECIRAKLYEGYKLPEICEFIIDLCFAPTTGGTGIGCDNMSIVIIALLDHSRGETLDQWYAKMNNNTQISATQQKERAVDGPPSTFGPLAGDFGELYKSMYGSRFEYGQLGNKEDDEYEREARVVGHIDEEDELEGNPSLVTLKKLLDTNAVTNENGVIYLDTLSAEAMLSQLRGGEEEDEMKIEEA